MRQFSRHLYLSTTSYFRSQLSTKSLSSTTCAIKQIFTGRRDLYNNFFPYQKQLSFEKENEFLPISEFNEDLDFCQALIKCQNIAVQRTLSQFLFKIDSSMQDAAIAVCEDPHGMLEDLESTASFIAAGEQTIELNVKKTWCWLSPKTTHLLIICRIMNAGAPVVSAFLVRRDHPCINIVDNEKCKGIGTLRGVDITFDSTKISPLDVVGVLGEGDTALFNINTGSWLLSSVYMINHLKSIINMMIPDLRKSPTLPSDLNVCEQLLYSLESMVTIVSNRVNSSAQDFQFVNEAFALKYFTSKYLSQILNLISLHLTSDQQLMHDVDSLRQKLDLFSAFIGHNVTNFYSMVRRCLENYRDKEIETIKLFSDDTYGRRSEKFDFLKKLLMFQVAGQLDYTGGLSDGKTNFVLPYFKRPSLSQFVDTQLWYLGVTNAHAFKGFQDNIWFNHYYHNLAGTHALHIYRLLSVLSRATHANNEYEINLASQIVENSFNDFLRPNYLWHRLKIQGNYTIHNEIGRSSLATRAIPFVHPISPDII